MTEHIIPRIYSLCETVKVFVREPLTSSRGQILVTGTVTNIWWQADVRQFLYKVILHESDAEDVSCEGIIVSCPNIFGKVGSFLH